MLETPIFLLAALILFVACETFRSDSPPAPRRRKIADKQSKNFSLKKSSHKTTPSRYTDFSYSTAGLIAFVTWLLATSSFSQDLQPLTVQTAVAVALTNNSALRVLEARIETARHNVGVARAYSYNPEFTYDEGLERVIGVSQTIEWPGKRALREAIAKQDVLAAQAGLDGFKVALAAEVRAKFYTLLAARKTVELRERELELAKRVFDTASNRVEHAFAPPTERTSAEAGMVLARRALRGAGNQVTQMKADLNVLLGRDAQAPTELQGELSTQQPDVALADLTNAALKVNPELRAAKLELEKRGLNVRLAKKSGAPDITVHPFYDEDTKSPDKTFGLGLSVPLPIWNRSKPKAEAAQAEEREAEADLQGKLVIATANIAKAFTAWSAAKEDFSEFSPELQKKMESDLAAAEQKYSSGEFPFLALLELKRGYFDYMNQYYESLTAMRDAQSELEKAAAISLEDLK